MKKVASAYTDMLLGGITAVPAIAGATAIVNPSMQAVIGPLATSIARKVVPPILVAQKLGRIHGTSAELSDPIEELKEMENNKFLALIPGVTESRTIRRQRLVQQLLSRDPRGKNDDRANHRDWALLNPLNMAAYPFAALAAALTSPDHPKDRAKLADADNEKLKTWLIPGYGTYHKYKDLGLSNRLGKLESTIAELKAAGKHEVAKQYEQLAQDNI